MSVGYRRSSDGSAVEGARRGGFPTSTDADGSSVLPQCLQRMLPPWMNVYSIITMSTVLASIVGINEMLTLTAQVHNAEGGRPDLLAPLYGFALLCFFIYCYPINLWTVRLERRFHVKS